MGSPHDYRAGQIVSLWDMLNNYAEAFLELGARINEMQGVFVLIDANQEQGWDKERDLQPEELLELEKIIRKAMSLCSEIQMENSANLLRGRLTDLPRTGRELNLLVEALNSELKGRSFLYLSPSRADWWELDDALSPAARTSFSAAHKELVAAGSAYAVGLSTACVFHCMRAAEIGVRALGKKVGVKFPDKPIELAEWQNILDNVEARIGKMQKLPRGKKKDQDLHFFSKAAVQFRYFKDAWRVRVAHARETYDDTQAWKVFEHTRDFFEDLAPRLRETR